ncbi:histidine triad (HIT) hydrolase [Chitinispirillum alkaliphilum]|nr:histidine triad (HIT) hydrolase [Chitinispirillum alkaliphilum]
MSSCLFCRIINKEIPTSIIHENEHAVFIKDIDPQAPEHYLAIPKKHYAAIQDIPAEDHDLLKGMMVSISEFITAHELEVKGYRIVLNCGENSGQSVFHIHFHILSGRKMEWPPG